MNALRLRVAGNAGGYYSVRCLSTDGLRGVNSVVAAARILWRRGGDNVAKKRRLITSPLFLPYATLRKLFLLSEEGKVVLFIMPLVFITCVDRFCK